MDSEPQDHMTTPSEITVSPPPNTETTVEREWTLVKPKSRYEILPLAVNDESWKLVSDKPQSVRKAALYVGNLRPEVSESELVQFIYSRCEAAGHEKPAEIRASLKPMKNTPVVWAHVVLPRAAAKTLLSPGFWPGQVYCRQWQFRESKGKPQGEQSSAHATDGPPAETSTVSSETSKASQDQPTNECSSANDSSLTLALSPESDWDSDTCAGSTSSASQALASFLENMTTPRGKSREHESLSPDS